MSFAWVEARHRPIETGGGQRRRLQRAPVLRDWAAGPEVAARRRVEGGRDFASEHEPLTLEPRPGRQQSRRIWV